MSEKFRSQDTSTQMRTELARTTSAPTPEDEITRATDRVLLDTGKPSSQDGRNTLFLLLVLAEEFNGSM